MASGAGRHQPKSMEPAHHSMARSIIGRLQTILQFSFVPGLSLLSTVLVLPLIAKQFGGAGWITLAVGQSIGALAGQFVGLAWPAIGPDAIASSTPKHRAALCMDSLSSRLIAALLVSPVTIIASAIAAPEHPLAACLYAFGTMLNGFTFAWYYWGAGEPNPLIRNEGGIRFAANVLSIPVLLLTHSLVVHASLLILLSLCSIALNMRTLFKEERAPYRWKRGLLAVKNQAPLTLARVITVAGNFLGPSIVSASGPGMLAGYTAIDRMQRAASNATDAVPAGLASWVSQPAPGTAQRRRRVFAAYWFIIALMVVITIAWAILGDPISTFLFDGQLFIDRGTQLLVGWSIAASAGSTGIGLLVMIPLGRQREVTSVLCMSAGVSVGTLYLGAISGQLAYATASIASGPTTALILYSCFLLWDIRRRVSEHGAEATQGWGKPVGRTTKYLHRLLLMGACLATASLIGFLTRGLLPQHYTSSCALYIGVARAEGGSDTSQANTYITNQMKSWAVVATSPLVLDPVIAELHLSESSSSLAKRVQVEGPSNTSILRIGVTDSKTDSAYAISRSVCSRLSSTILASSPVLPGNARLVNVTEVQSPVVSGTPSSPQPRDVLLVSLLFGALLGAVLILVMERLLLPWKVSRERT